MRTAILLCLFAVFGNIATAQLTILPQAGFENSQTCIEYNELSSFSPLCLKPTPVAGLRLDYKFKKQHGPYLGICSSRSIVKYSFSDAETGMKNYTAKRGQTQLRLEAGYQVSTKPIYLNKTGSAKSNCQRNMERTGCGSQAKMSCAGKANKTASAKGVGQSKGAWVRILPSLGVAYIPGAPSAEINTKYEGTQTVYQYNAGNWNTALVGGVNFEFGKKAQSSFLISFQYLKGMGNMGERRFATLAANKLTNTSLESNASAWNVKMGIPISLAKKKPSLRQPLLEKNYRDERKCGQYKIEYKSRCSKQYYDQ